MKSIAVINQKGGVGKTTTAATLATIWARGGKRVLAVDMDPQGNLGLMLGEMYDPERPTVYNVLSRAPEVERVDAEGATVSTRDGVDLIPSSILLDALQREDAGGMEFRLRIALDAVEGRYDVCVIDCPPTLSIVTVNALCAAVGVIIPMQCEYFSLEGLSDLVNAVKRVRFNKNADLKMIGLLRVMFDPRMTLQKQVSDQLKENFGDRVFDTVIPRNVRLAEAPSYGLPGVLYDPSSRGAKAYLQFARELIKRVETPAKAKKEK